MSIHDNVYVAGEKPFDITQHEWSDKDIEFYPSSNLLIVGIDGVSYEDATINKDDAIAIAKHFKLTEEDLK